MHMHDWNNYRQQLVAGVGSFGKLNPDTVKGYVTLSGAGQKAGHLDDKTRELIALAVAISPRCDGCIRPHRNRPEVWCDQGRARRSIGRGRRHQYWGCRLFHPHSRHL